MNMVIFFSGYECPTLSTSTICAEGYYSTLGSAVCSECPDGQYNDAQGEASCTDCPEGYSCSDKTLAPVICPAGEYRQVYKIIMNLHEGHLLTPQV